MNKVIYAMISVAALLMAASCSEQQKKAGDERPENLEAKQLLQGVWLDEVTEASVFQMKGDTVYFADSTSMPAYFKVVDDSLFMGTAGRYRIEKQTEHVLWFTDQNGETTKYVKSDEAGLDTVFERAKPQILTLSGVLKRDTVVFHDGERYHLYVAINPTKYKVVHHAINEDGLNVENVYYDNIIHLSVFKGASQLFSRDFRKQLYEKQVPRQVLSQAVLNNMTFDKADDKGFHVQVSVCVPDDVSCYMVEHIISYDGRMTNTHLLEY